MHIPSWFSLHARKHHIRYIWFFHTKCKECGDKVVTVLFSGITDRGRVIDELVELVDIFPTLVDLAGFSDNALPQCQDGRTDEPLCHEGAYLAPMLRERYTRAVKKAIFSDKVQQHIIGKTGEVNGKTVMNKD